MPQSFALVALAAVCLWVIVDKHVHTGVLVTSGLSLISSACLAMLDNAWITRATAILVYGCLLVAAGMLWRRFAAPWFARQRLAHAPGVSRSRWGK